METITPASVGELVTFTAAVSATAPGAGTPTGTATFSTPGQDDVVVPLAGGEAGYNTSDPPAGVHTITGTYDGDINFTGCTATLDYAVGLGETTMIITATP